MPYLQGQIHICTCPSKNVLHSLSFRRKCVSPWNAFLLWCIIFDSGRIIRAYRQRRIVQRCQQIGLYVFDLWCGILKDVLDIGRVRKPQPSETGLHLWHGHGLAAELQVWGRAALHMADQLRNIARVVVHAGRGQQGVVVPPPYCLFNFLCLWWIDRWISITVLSIILINIISVRFSAVCTSDFPKPGFLLFGRNDVLFFAARLSAFRKAEFILIAIGRIGRIIFWELPYISSFNWDIPRFLPVCLVPALYVR